MVRITRRKRWSSKLPLSSRPTMIFPAPAQVRSAASIAIAVLLCAGSAGAAVRHTVLNRRIEAGQTLGGALNAAGIPDAQRESILGALGGVLDFRRCQIGDQFRIALEDDQVQGFDYRQNSRDEWQVRREGSRYLASRRKIEIEKRIETVELQIDSSLYQAALAAGEDPALPLSISAVYEGQSVGRKKVFRYQLPNGEVSYFQEDGKSARKAFLRSPLKYANVTSRFGSRFHPVLKYVRDHNGVDYGAAVGTPVWAVAEGVVTRAGADNSSGKHLCLRHMNSLETCYLHLSGFASGVRVGARVQQKQVIAFTGNTGLTTAPHLHFALKRGGHFINPLTQKFPRAEPVPLLLREDFAQKISPLLAGLEHHPVAEAALAGSPQE